MLLATLDFARIASALVVVVGVTSHLGSGAALSPRRCRIASVGAHNRTGDATIARSAAHNPSTSRIKSEAALNPSLVEKKVHPHNTPGPKSQRDSHATRGPSCSQYA